MKKEINNIRFNFFVICFVFLWIGTKETIFAQDSLKAPSVILAKNPQRIQIPTITGQSYFINSNRSIHAIKLEPPRTLTLPVTTVTYHKQSLAKGQIISGKGFFTSYTAENGLPLDAVFSSCMDHLGNLWFGTQGGGVSRYDGKSFITYTTAQGLASNNVWNIMEDKRGNMWFCTNGGASKYDGKTFVNYTISKGVRSHNIWCVAEDKAGNIWLGTSGEGVIKFNGKSLVSYTASQGLANNTVKSILTDKKGNVWFGTDGGGISRYDGKSFVNYTTAQGLANDNIYCIAEDKQGNIWFGTNGGGVSKYDGKSFVNYTTAEGLANNSVRSILIDRTGYIWLGTDGGGVSRYDGKSFVNYTIAQGLTNNYVYSITEDKTGNIWFCTTGGGVSKYEGQSFVNYTTAHGLRNNNIWSIVEDERGNIWVGTDEGISRFDGISFTNYITTQVEDVVLCIIEDGAKNIWFGTYGGGICRYDGKSFTNYTTAQGLLRNSVRSLLKDKKGNLWIGTDGGVSYYDGKSFTNYTTSQGLADNIVNIIFEDKTGNLWFGTDKGVSCFDGHYFTNYSTDQGLVNNVVFSILEDKKENLWFGTQQGLSYFNHENRGKPGVPSFKTITTENGLPDQYITQLTELQNGKIAVGTNLGIAIFDQPSFKERKLKGLELFNSSNGYPIKDVNAGENAMYKGRNGLIWIGTGSDKTGLACFDYSAVHRNLGQPEIVIKNIKVEGENICWENILKKGRAEKGYHRSSAGNSLNVPYDSLSFLMSEFYAFGKSVPQDVLNDQFTRFGDIQFDSITKFYPLPKNLVLPYIHNQINFEFAAIEPNRPYLVKYQYILEGYNKEWSPVTNETSVSFGNIYEGTYTFKLKAQSPFGVWSEPVAYSFKVLPPWWRTWWVYLIYGVLGICAVFLITLWNGRRLRLKAKELAEEVRKATATILEQKKIVEEKNKRITESIDYAQRIQNAILPERNYIETLFNNYFVYYQPKEIVSGDFYWFGQKNDKVIFAAIDCTGHGVPGALMSMIGNSLLNEIINGKGIVEADAILNQLRDDIIYALKQNDAPESQKDGMDIALCVLDKKEKWLEFSGAHNSLYHIRNNIFTELKGDMQAIGYEKRDKQTFFKNKMEVQEGDMLYLFTDGFADQKGGAERKKFYYKPFRQLITSIHAESMVKQEEILRDTFNKWKGDIEQIDDVLVIGIRL